MQQDAATLQARLDALIRIAKSNERKQENFQKYELSLLNSNGLGELLALILEEHKVRFQLTEVTLLLLDPEYEFQRLIEASPNIPGWPKRLLFTDNHHTIAQYFSLQQRPRLTAFSPFQHQILFPGHSNLRSVALLPLVRQQRLIGSLNLGSRKAERFQANIGTQFLQHLAAVVSACLENARLHEHIKLVGLRDPLTGVNNRRFFDQRVEEEVSRALRTQSPLSCLFIDLDHFKRVNDQHGHQAGDILLKQVAEILNDSMRSCDVIARYGGEEFVALLADTTQSAASDIANRIRESIEATEFEVGHGIRLKQTLSIGLATLSDTNSIKNTRQLLQAADQAVYAAKLAGRNKVRLHGTS
ncbi:diguanylate cyclase [Methylophaga lonarensis MPL]|uniref:diguanylate cyclase n=1 Tax=Methylophaga lonarensis MPL TaxID=1286106 RepID=M7P181_9GAMM|nr:DUF484 family protein [Methylophaga lonarensis]EMR13217.1 diguanylate cyclase [Methylophaga lonarensis MPL]